MFINQKEICIKEMVDCISLLLLLLLTKTFSINYDFQLIILN